MEELKVEVFYQVGLKIVININCSICREKKKKSLREKKKTQFQKIPRTSCIDY